MIVKMMLPSQTHLDEEAGDEDGVLVTWLLGPSTSFLAFMMGLAPLLPMLLDEDDVKDDDGCNDTNGLFLQAEERRDRCSFLLTTMYARALKHRIIPCLN